VGGVRGERFPPAGPDAGLGRLVEHNVDPVEEGLEIGGDQVLLAEGEAVVGPGDGEVPLLDLARVVVGEAVDADHLVALREEPLGEGRAHEPGDPGHDAAHRAVVASLEVPGGAKSR